MKNDQSDSASKRFLPKREVLKRAGFSSTTLWREVREKRFPKPVQLSANRVGWVEREIDDWMESRIEARAQ